MAGAHMKYIQIMKNNNTEEIKNIVNDENFLTENPFLWTPLHYAAAVENFECVKQILEIRSQYLFCVDKYNRTALSIAAARGNSTITKFLLQVGADVNKGLPLCYATSGGNKDCVIEILNYGGNIQEEDITEHQTRYTPLTIAVIKNKVDVLQLLLEKCVGKDNNAESCVAALHLACQSGNLECVKILLTKEPDLSYQDVYHNTALDYALVNEHIDIVKYLLTKGSPIDTGFFGQTPLHSAVSLGSEYVSEILNYDANVNAQDYEGVTPLYSAIDTIKIDESVIEVLMLNNANPNIAAFNSWTPLHLSCVSGNMHCVRMLLNKASKDDVNAVTHDNITPLHVAAANGHSDICKMLLEKGAFVNININSLHNLCFTFPYVIDSDDYKAGYQAKHIAEEKKYPNIVAMLNDYADSNREQVSVIECIRNKNIEEISKHHLSINETDLLGWTCLHHAVYIGDYKIINECIKSGASVNAADKYGRTAITIASYKGNLDNLKLLFASGGDITLGDSLFYAIDKDHIDCVKYLLDHGAIINEQDLKEQTPLIYAVVNNHPAIVRELVNRNADTFLTNEDDLTALHLACLYGFTECVKILIENNADVNVQSKHGDTPLIYATVPRDNDIIKLLLENGADVNIAEKFKDSPIHLACHYDSFESAKEILHYSPNLSKMTSEELTPLFISTNSINIFRLLLQNGADVTETMPGGWTLLHAAAFYGNLETCCELLNQNVDIDALTAECITPLYIAAARGHLNIVSKLVGQGCLIDVPINNLSNDWKEDRPLLRKVIIMAGTTPLLAAIVNGHLEIVKFLQKSGASLNTHTEDNMNALTIAVSKSHSDIIEHLMTEKFEVDENMKTYLLTLCQGNPKLKEQIENYLTKVIS